jgi:aminoglycoside phosphotransferase (APT) family kinase protein
MNLSDVKLSDSDKVGFNKYQQNLFFSKIDCGYPVGVLTPHLAEHEQSIRKIFQEKMGLEVTRIMEHNRRTLHYVYLVETSKGPYIIRINSAGMFFKELNFYVEVWAMQELAKLNLPHMVVYEVDTSRNIAPFDYEIEAEVPGISMHDAPIEFLTLDIFGQLGKIVAGVHGIQTRGYGPFNIPNIIAGEAVGIHETWVEYMTLNLDKHLEYNIMTSTLTVSEADAIRDILAVFKTIEVPQPAFIHGDIANHNTFIENGRITAIIDWEDCISGDPIFDLAYFGTGCFGRDDWFDGFLAGYKSVRALPEDFEKRFWAYYLRISIAKSIVRYRFKTATKRSLPDVRNRILAGLSRLSAVIL